MNITVLNPDGSIERIIEATDLATAQIYYPNCRISLDSDAAPVITPIPEPDGIGFTDAMKAAVGGAINANAIAKSYPNLFPAILINNWTDVQELIIDAQTTGVISADIYSGIKSLSAEYNIPITL